MHKTWSTEYIEISINARNLQRLQHFVSLGLKCPVNKSRIAVYSVIQLAALYMLNQSVFEIKILFPRSVWPQWWLIGKEMVTWNWKGWQWTLTWGDTRTTFCGCSSSRLQSSIKDFCSVATTKHFQFLNKSLQSCINHFLITSILLSPRWSSPLCLFLPPFFFFFLHKHTN